MPYKMAVFPTLIVLLCHVLVMSEAANLEGEGVCAALGYWNLKLPNTSIPNALREAICPHTIAEDDVKSADVSISSQKYIATGGGGDATIYSHKYFIPQVDDGSVFNQKYVSSRGGDATIYSHRYFTPQVGDASVSSQKYIPSRGDVSTSTHKYVSPRGDDATIYSHKYITPQLEDASISSQKYIPPQEGDATLYSHRYHGPQVQDVSISSHKYIPPRGRDATIYSHKYIMPQVGDVSISSHKYIPPRGGDVTLYSHKYNTPQIGDVSISTHKYSPVQEGDVTLYNRKYIIDRNSSPKQRDITLDKDSNKKNVEYHRQLSAIDPLLSIFFFEKNLHIGTNLMVHLEVLKAYNLVGFIPRSTSDEIPFSLEKLLAAQDMLKIPQGSHMSIAMERTLKKCESPAISGETAYCATSMESMIDYTTAKFGSNQLNVLVTDLPSNSNYEDHQYTVIDMVTKSNSSSKHVICHNLVYPYAIYMCHESKGTKIFELSLKTQGAYGCPIPVVAICHADTSGWNPEHAAFVALNVKPGAEGICHFMLEGTIAWLLANKV